MSLEGKTIAIFGAAGQIGREVSARFDRAGARLLLSDANADELQATLSLVGEKSGHMSSVVDVLSQREVRSFLETSSEDCEIDVVINLVGTGTFKPFWGRTFEEFMKVIEINLGGAFNTTVEAARIWKDRGHGSIINTASIYGIVSSDSRIYEDTPRMNSEAYSASKAGVLQLTRYFAAHLGPYGIRVNSVSPGGVWRNQGPRFLQEYSSKVPMGRMAEASEIAGAFMYLASEESGYVSGHNLVVDGGFTSW